MMNDKLMAVRAVMSLTVLSLAIGPGQSCGAEVPKVPVPSSPYLPVIYRFADAMLEHGRDVYGPQKTGLFLSALDRATLAPLTNRPPAPEGVVHRVGLVNGPLVGTSPQHDQNFLRLLYTLSELSGRAKYRDAANAELKWLMDAPDERITLLTEPRQSWDVMRDQFATSVLTNDDDDGWFRPWMLWDKCASVALHKTTGVAAALALHNAGSDAKGDPLRQLGFYQRALAVACEHTKTAQVLSGIEEWPRKKAPFPSLISFAIDCDGAAHYLPEPVASRLRETAAAADSKFHSHDHPLASRGGFLVQPERATHRWHRPGLKFTTAQVGLMCVSRYENTGSVKYRDLMHAAADAYLESEPSEAEDVWPGTVGHAISLQVAAWRSTAEQRYLDRARYFGDWALKTFFDGPLPRASTKSTHYESITGSDTLALALVELHLHILGITAVRWPPNTIDR